MKLKLKIFITIIIYLNSTQLFAGKFDRIYFLHHSTGQNLINEGGVYDLFDKYNQEHNTTFQFSDEWSTPSGNYPYDYYIDTFSPDRLKNYVDSCDVIIFKHCYPGSDIAGDIGHPDLNSPRQSLENYKLQYRALREQFDQYPDAKFLIMTIPPRHRNHSEATPESAARANEFAKWVMGEFLTENGPHYNIGVFDFRSLLTDSIGYLKYEYEIDHNSTDCHPNKLANETIGPLFFNAIIQFCNQRVSPLKIYNLLSPTISKEQLISGTKSPAAAMIEILIPTAIVGTVELFSDTTWQVLVKDMSEGWNYVTATAKSPSFLDSEPTIDSIFVDSVNDPPATFLIIEPNNDYSTYDSLITFIWRTAIDLDPYDEVNYQLELCDSSDFNAPLTFEAQTDTFITIIRPGFGDYWWRVKALDKQLAVTYSNETRRIRFTGNNPPSTFSLIKPQNDYLTSDSLITFVWRHATDLDIYDEVNYCLELCDSSDFNVPLVFEAQTDTFVAIKRPGFGEFWWRVKAIDKQLAVTYSNETRRIRFTGNNPPSIFSLVEPQNNYATSDSSITFIWRHATDLDSSDEVNYQLELCDSSDFNVPLVYVAHKDTFLIIERPGAGDYWWRVKAVDKQLAVTYSNETRRIRFTGNNPPSTFSLVEPQNNYVTSDSSITFIWRHATDLDLNDEVNYQLELCDSSNFNMPVVYEAGKDTIVLIKKLGAGDYWWRAKAIDKQLTITYSDEIRKIRFTSNVSTVNNNTEGKIPDDILLKQNYPNPFNSSSLIQFQIDGKSKIYVNLVITNLLGHTVKILVAEHKLPGIYTIQWDGKDEFGEMQNSGVYLCTIRAGAFNKAIKLMLIK